MAGITDGIVWKFPAKRFDHLEVQLFRLARIGAGAVHDDQIIFTNGIYTFMDLLHRGHACRNDDGLASFADMLQKVMVGE